MRSWSSPLAVSMITGTDKVCAQAAQNIKSV